VAKPAVKVSKARSGVAFTVTLTLAERLVSP